MGEYRQTFSTEIGNNCRKVGRRVGGVRMAFGIRVPGFRVSTSGVRVGPRMANVSVGRGGARASVGPRGARVRVSGRGVSASTGVGGVRASTRGGVSAGVAVGPVFGSVGRRGAVLGLGVGPIFSAVQTSKARSRGTTGGVSQLAGSESALKSPRIRATAVQEYGDYRKSLDRAGVARRTRAEMRVAGVHAALLRIPTFIASTQSFVSFRPMFPGHYELMQRNKELATEEIRESLGLKAPPSIFTDYGTLRLRVIQKLENSGVRRPQKPTTVQGIRRPQFVSLHEAVSTAREEILKESSISRRIFGRGSIEDASEQLGKTLWAEQKELIAKSESDYQAAVERYESGVDEETKYEIEQEKRVEREKANFGMAMQRQIQERIQALESVQQPITKKLDDAWRRFTALDPVLNLIVLSAALSDNAGTAAPVGIDGGDLLILMTMPPAPDVIWPEIFTGPNPTSVTRIPKYELQEEYVTYLKCHSLAAAREAFAVQPKFERVRVIAISDGESSLNDREVLSSLTLDRRGAGGFDKPETSRQTSLMHFAERWSNAIDANDEAEVIRLLDEWDEKAAENYEESIQEWRDQLALLDSGFDDLSKVRRKFSKAIGGLIAFGLEAGTRQSIDVDATEIAELDVSAEEMSTPEFWILAVQLEEAWESESFDVEELRRQSEEISKTLNPARN